MFRKYVNSPLIEQVAYSAQSFLSLILVSKIFDVTDFGLYNIVVFASLVFSNVLISITFLPMVPLRNKIESKDIKNYEDIVKIITLILCSISFPISLVIFFENSIPVGTSILLSFFLALRSSFEYSRRYIIILEKCYQSLMVSIFSLILLLLLVAYGKIYNEMIGINLYLLILTCVYLIAQCRILKLSCLNLDVLISRRSIKLVKLHVYESKWLLMTAITQIFSSNYFLIAITNHLGAFYLGVFRAVQDVTNIFNPLISYGDNNTFVQASKIKDSGGDYKKYIFQVGLKMIICILLPLIIINWFSYDIIKCLYSSDIARFNHVLPIFSLSLIVVIFSTFFRLYLRLESINNSSFWTNVLISFISFFIAPYVVSKYGVLGAAYGILATQVAFLIGIYSHFRFITWVRHVK